mgnify:CR=1 FL=1
MPESQLPPSPCDCETFSLLSQELKRKTNEANRLRRDLKNNKYRVQKLKTQKKKLLERLAQKKPKPPTDANHRFFSFALAKNKK